jgi:hypothetical protein
VAVAATSATLTRSTSQRWPSGPLVSVMGRAPRQASSAPGPERAPASSSRRSNAGDIRVSRMGHRFARSWALSNEQPLPRRSSAVPGAGVAGVEQCVDGGGDASSGGDGPAAAASCRSNGSPRGPQRSSRKTVSHGRRLGRHCTEQHAGNGGSRCHGTAAALFGHGEAQ